VALHDKTEPATQRRRDDARDEGRVAKSTDMISALVMLVSLLILRVAAPYLFRMLTEIMQETFGNLHSRTVSTESISSLVVWYGSRFGMLCMPILLGTGAIALVANVTQVGLRVTPKAIKPDFTRIDPLKGITKLVSIRSLVELAKSIAKVGLVGYFVYAFLKNEYPSLMGLSGMSVQGIGLTLADMCWRLLVRGCIVMFVIGALDYIYQRLQFEQSLKMTKQEVKDEFKRSEGDPQIKSRMRQRFRELARRRMVQDVAKADVVITNPTHIAVALKYDSENMGAPTVVAKGQRLLAEKIKAVAAENRVPIVENKPIARLLYKTVEVGQQIPDDLYQAVAEILAYVYQLNHKVAGARRAS
jgi:flagellar biosynthesis protein FlhB